MSVIMCPEFENNNLFIYIFLTSISRLLLHLHSSTHIANTHLEGSVSQKFDIGLSFYFMLCRRLGFEKKCKNMTKVTRFLS